MEDCIRIPKGEVIWQQTYVRGKLRYVITSKQTRDYYYIYLVENGELKKLGKGRNPAELVEKYEKY